MDLETLEGICRSFPAVESEIKWRSDLVFMIGKKMFCMIDLDSPVYAVSFPVPAEDFEELSQQMYFRPAPYFGRYNWVMLDDISKMKKSDWQQFLQSAYEIVSEKLSVKKKKELGLI